MSKLIFTREQIQFLKDEIGIDESSFAFLNKEEWNDIREKCFDIEVDEEIEHMERLKSDPGNGESEREILATSLVDAIYDQLLT